MVGLLDGFWALHDGLKGCLWFYCKECLHFVVYLGCFCVCLSCIGVVQDLDFVVLIGGVCYEFLVVLGL